MAYTGAKCDWILIVTVWECQEKRAPTGSIRILDFLSIGGFPFPGFFPQPPLTRTVRPPIALTTPFHYSNCEPRVITYIDS